MAKVFNAELWCGMGWLLLWRWKIESKILGIFQGNRELDLDDKAVVLDIGGGSPVTGTGFFGLLICQYVKKVIIMDSTLTDTKELPSNVELIKEKAQFSSLKNLFMTQPDITHIVTISTLEHIEPTIREEIIAAVNNCFKGNIFVASFEYHAKRCFFEYQLTTKSASYLFSHFTNFYMSEFYSSPIWSENAFVPCKVKDKKIRFYQKLYDKFKNLVNRISEEAIPAWYPVLVKFERINLLDNHIKV